MISFLCPGCGRPLVIKDEFAGKYAACPQCKGRMKVPGPAPRQTPAPATPTTVGYTPPPVGGARLDFLAAPQGPGELGRLGPYRVLKVLGAGGMGMVLLAEDPVLRRSLALKVMQPELAARPDARQRFLREARATAAIEHPHIVAIYQVGEDRSVAFLAMPFLKGESLDDRLRREKRLPAAEVVRLGRQIAEGLAAAHRNGLIHRDIKPGNVWLEAHEGGQAPPAPSDWVKILDFGLARALADDDGHLTKTGAILGTPAYMAPEQARGEVVDARCDLFSLGGVLYRMLTGEKPFKGTDPLALIAALALDTPRPVRELNPETPPALADLVMKLLTKDPAGRPPTARAVADALAAVEDVKPPALEGGSPPTMAAKGGGRRHWLLPLAGGALLLGLALFFFGRPAIPPSRGEPQNNAQPVPPPETEKEITNTVGMKLVRIDPGNFTMGSPEGEKDSEDDEGPQHEVEITKAFFLGACPVTRGQFKVFVEDAGYRTEAEAAGFGGNGMDRETGNWHQKPEYTWRHPGFAQTDAHPVVQVNWNDALAFCAWLSKKEGKVYELPTEAEWEYTCRAGTTTRFWCGDVDDSLKGNANIADASLKGMLGAQVSKDTVFAPWSDDYPFTSPVGSFMANPWGLYDMHGNVWQWCADHYGPYPEGSVKDPKGKNIGNNRIVRGGSWSEAPAWCRSAQRMGSDSSDCRGDCGFRVVLRPSTGTP